MKLISKGASMFFRTLILLISTLLMSCATVKSWMPWSDSEPEQTPPASGETSANDTAGSAVPASKSNSSEELSTLQLKQSETWSRIDRLEYTLKEQRARIAVLEKAIVLGMLPDELLNPDDRKIKAKAKNNHNRNASIEDIGFEAEPQEPAQPLPQAAAAPKTAPEQASSEEDYLKQLAAAQESYRSGNFGRAIAEFSLIGQKYADRDTQFQHEYWVAMCWLNLKEYQTAHQGFEGFIKKHPTSTWIPKAKFYQARAEISLGLKEKGLAHLKELIQSYPLEDASEMAKLEISRLERTL